MKHICLYCKKEKEETEFNREHVVPQMYGRYQNGLVLNKYQVCKECNSYFSEKIENELALDSIEALDRIQYGTKKMSDGRELHGERMKIRFAETILKGVEVKPVSDSSNPERMRLKCEPLIGFLNMNGEYDFYKMDQIPKATADEKNRLLKANHPIITVDISKEESEKILKKKGWITDNSVYSESEPETILSADNILFNITGNYSGHLGEYCLWCS